jgi:hypothetical protein
VQTPGAWFDWICFGAGAALAFGTWFSVIGTLIVPRPVFSRISRTTGNLTWRFFGLLCRPLSTYEARDRVLAWQGPFSLFLRLLVWVALFDIAYALMLLPFVDGQVARAFDEAGSGLFTLGYAAPSHAGSSAMVDVAAFSGLVVVALQIGYLPTIYAAFNRREAEVTLLSARSGTPAWGPELLARTRFGLANVDGGAELVEMYRTWERWSADVAESHSTYTTLCWLRSPKQGANWLIALLSVMDAAAMHLALRPSTVPALRARLAVRAGFTALNAIARAVGVDEPEDADPDAPIDVTFEQFAEAVAMLDSLDFGSEVSAAQAWPHFRGWRVNYESVVYELAYRIDAPPALWSGPRRWPYTPMPPSRPANRVASDSQADDPQRLMRKRNG